MIPKPEAALDMVMAGPLPSDAPMGPEGASEEAAEAEPAEDPVQILGELEGIVARLRGALG